jgi:TonB family protein
MIKRPRLRRGFSAGIFWLSAAVLLLTMLKIEDSLRAQGGQAGASIGKLIVPAFQVTGLCTTMVSPEFPQAADVEKVPTAVTVRVIIRTSGSVTPLYMVSGKSAFESKAMNAVRLWRYKPYLRVGRPVDVTTDVRVDFNPDKPGGLVTHPNS